MAKKKRAIRQPENAVARRMKRQEQNEWAIERARVAAFSVGGGLRLDSRLEEMSRMERLLARRMALAGGVWPKVAVVNEEKEEASNG